MELYYRKYGKGKPIIILHGIFGMSDNWVSIAKRLTDDYEVFLLDLRNHGQSPHSFEFNYDVMNNDLSEFINEHGLTSPIIIGHSMGGKVAMNYALQNSEQVDKLIIVDISPVAYPEHYEHTEIIEAMLTVDFNKVKTYSDIDKQLEHSLLTTRLRQFLLKNVLKKDDNTFTWKFGLEEIRVNLDSLLEGIKWDKQYTKPALFIKGGLSNYIKEEDYKIINQFFPNSEIKTIPNATHWVHADQPKIFLGMVREFLNNVNE